MREAPGSFDQQEKNEEQFHAALHEYAQFLIVEDQIMKEEMKDQEGFGEEMLTEAELESVEALSHFYESQLGDEQAAKDNEIYAEIDKEFYDALNESIENMDKEEQAEFNELPEETRAEIQRVQESIVENPETIFNTMLALRERPAPRPNYDAIQNEDLRNNLRDAYEAAFAKQHDNKLEQARAITAYILLSRLSDAVARQNPDQPLDQRTVTFLAKRLNTGRNVVQNALVNAARRVHDNHPEFTANVREEARDAQRKEGTAQEVKPTPGNTVQSDPDAYPARAAGLRTAVDGSPAPTPTPGATTKDDKDDRKLNNS